jgi:RNA polymerase sigma factor (sigma-70 family)
VGAGFRDFYRANALWAARLSFLLTADVATGEDVAQEAFLGLHRHFEEVENPRAYLRVTLARLASRRGRRDRRRNAAQRLVAKPEAVSDATSEMFDAVGRLPPRQRAVIVLRYFEDLSEAEISAALGCPPGTVKSLASRALRQLKKEIEQ